VCNYFSKTRAVSARRLDAVQRRHVSMRRQRSLRRQSRRL
jgi:hypothetical protein